MRMRQIQGDPDAVDGRRKAAEEKLLLRARKNLIQARLYRPLAGRIAGAVDIGRVLQQRQHAALAVFGKSVKVESLAVGRREVDLEVARMDDHAYRRVDGQSHAVHQAVRHPNRLNRKRAKRELRARSNLDQLRLVEQLVLFELALDVSQRELGAIDRHVQLGENPRQSADVVLVPVRQNDAAHALLVLDEVGDVRNDDVHAEQLRLRGTSVLRR